MVEGSEVVDGRLRIHVVDLAERSDLGDLLHGGAVVHASLYRCCCGVRGGDMLLVSTS